MYEQYIERVAEEGIKFECNFVVKFKIFEVNYSNLPAGRQVIFEALFAAANQCKKIFV